MTPEQKAGFEVGQKLRAELSALLDKHLTGANAKAQMAILAVLHAEAVRGACESGIPLETALQAVREMYKLYAQERKP